MFAIYYVCFGERKQCYALIYFVTAQIKQILFLCAWLTIDCECSLIFIYSATYTHGRLYVYMFVRVAAYKERPITLPEFQMKYDRYEIKEENNNTSNNRRAATLFAKKTTTAYTNKITHS